MGILSINDGYILSSWHGGTLEKGCIRIDEKTGLIIETGSDVTPQDGDRQYSMPGNIIAPGLVVGHHHLYSALARGMNAPKKTPSSFVETLQYLWWVLDRALDEKTVYHSAMAGLCGAAKLGITGIVDHHASPSFISGSLKTMAGAFEKFHMRGSLCYEVTDRNGPDEGAQGIRENRDFALSHMKHPLLRGAVGAHASFTIKDKTLDGIASLCSELDLPLHIHLLEDASDRTESINNFGMSPVARLQIRNLLRKGDIIVHGVHLTDHELSMLVDKDVYLLHNTRSNMNNRVGRAFLEKGNWALGTDGIDSDILSEARSCFFRGREDMVPPAFDAPLAFLKNSQNVLGSFFNENLSELAAGSAADITILDYNPPTPLSAGNFAGHVLFGMESWAVRSSMVAGKWLLYDRKIQTVDEMEVMAHSREAAKTLYEKMEKLQ
ncbi:MAG: amidohydrolase family protein [Deltaproteobacteria bacterium]|nr:amidohydrolase family protein [Deltaproteobacteria bacterium]